MQIDPIVNRVIKHDGEAFGADAVLEEVLTTVVPGVFQFSMMVLEWIPQMDDSDEIVEAEESGGGVRKSVNVEHTIKREDSKSRRGSSVASGRRYSGLGRTASISSPCNSNTLLFCLHVSLFAHHFSLQFSFHFLEISKLCVHPV